MSCIITVNGLSAICSGDKRDGVGCTLYYDYDPDKTEALVRKAAGGVITELYSDPVKCTISSPPPGLFDIKKIKAEYRIDEDGVWRWSRARGRYPYVVLDGYFIAKEAAKASELGMPPLPEKSPIRLLLRELRFTSCLPVRKRVLKSREIFDRYGSIGEEFTERFASKESSSVYEEEAEAAGCSAEEIFCLQAADVMSMLYFPSPEPEGYAVNLLDIESKKIV